MQCIQVDGRGGVEDVDRAILQSDKQMDWFSDTEETTPTHLLHIFNKLVQVLVPLDCVHVVEV